MTTWRPATESLTLTGTIIHTYATDAFTWTPMRVYESYVGLRGQQRLGLVDNQGRVHHHDLEDLEDAPR